MNKKQTEYRDSEKTIEDYLVRKVKALGGLALKYYNGTVAGYPDRIVMLPGGTAFWVELKSKGEKPRPLQNYCIAQLRNVDQRVYVADSIEMVDLIIKKEYEVQSAPVSE